MATDPSDFLADHTGGSEKKTAAIVASAEGKVLLIDEAYGLGKDDPYCKAVIDTLVSKIPRSPANIAVVMCGCVAALPGHWPRP